MWSVISKDHPTRTDISTHAAELLSVAPKHRAAIQASIAKTSFTITQPGPRQGKQCIVTGAGLSGPGGARLPTHDSECLDGGGRSYPELFYSGVLKKEQVDTIYETLTTSNNTKYGTHKALMTLGTLHPPSPHTHSTTFLPPPHTQVRHEADDIRLLRI